MKKRLIVPTFIASLALITGGLSFAAAKNNSSVEETFDATDPNANWGGLRATPFGDRYTTNWSSEPEYTTQKPLQFSTMNVGDTWKNYQGFESGDKPITVAVIDSGIDIYHEDFLSADAKNVTITESNVESYSILDPKSCYIYDTSKGYYSSSVKTEVGIKKAYDTDTYDEKYNEYYSHGTASAACIGAAINGVGGLGIAPKCNLLIIRMDFYFTSLDKAIRYAADNGADVINMSLGAYAESFEDGYGDQQSGSASTATALTSAINYALGKDCVVVAAAGNEKTNHKSYPACNAGVIGVGALASKSTSSAADFSNFNSNTDTSSTNNNVDVMAPGYVYTANMDKDNGPKSSGNLKDTSYQNTQGTSFASPLTAGAVALARSKYPEKTHTEIENLLISTCTDIGTTGWDTKFGYGRVNITTLLGTTSNVEELTLSESSIQLYNNGVTKSIVGDVIPSNATNRLIHWTSSNTNVATVPATSNAGTEVTITPKGVGTTTITATSDFDPSISSTCTVTVSPYVSSEFTLSVGKSTLMEGETTQAIVNFKNTNPTYSDVLYESSNEKVATISDSGLITAVGVGTTTITAMSSDDMQEITITVTGDPTKQTATIVHSDWQTGGSSASPVVLTATKGVLSASVTKGYNTGSQIREYAGGSITISVSGGVINAFTINCDDDNNGGTCTVTSGGGTAERFNNSGKYGISYVAGTTPSSSVTFTNGSQARFSSIDVTYKLNETPVVTNYTVSFNSNGGTGSMTSATTSGSSYTVPACTFTRTNYTFNKWALGSTSGTQYSVGDTITAISSDITLYALWTENQSTGGGDSGEETSKIYTFTDKSWKPWTSVKDGAGFLNSGVQVTKGVSGANANSKDSFSNVKKAIVTYCTNSSSGAGTVTVKIGNQTLGSFSPSTTGGTTARTSEITSTTALSGIANISVTCTTNSIYICGIEIFEGTSGGDPVTQNYTVSFDSNGGTGSMTNATTNGSSYTVPACTFTRTNYTFNKWALGSASGTQYSVGETISGISSNITLFATWTENQSTGGDAGNYYDGITATSGTPLLGALHDLSVENHTNYNSYSDISTTNCFKTDPYGTSNSYIRDFYSGGKMNNTIVSSGSNGWNREHLWCQSLSNGLWGQAGGGADLQHLRPTVATINSDRGSKKYAAISGSKTESTYVDPDGKTMTGGYHTSTLFEPIDSKKGDVARILMYTYMHYNKAINIDGTKDGSNSSYFGTLNFTNVVSATNEAAAKQLLLTWNELDPVDSIEITRNAEAAKITGCRNPFIDHPEYANAIWGTAPVAKTLSSITLSGSYQTTFTVGDTFSYTGLVVTANYSDGTHATVTPTSVSSPNMSSAGTKTVTISYTEGGVTETATYEITVSAATVAVTGVSLNPTSLELSVGEDATLTATVAPSNASNKNVTWESNNNAVARVNNGTITAVSAGNATITVKTVDGNKTATCAVTVKSSGSSDSSEITKTYNFSSDTNFTNIAIGDVSLSIVSNGGSNPTWNNSDGAARIYHHGKYTFTSSKKIISITFNFKNGTETNALTVDKGTYSSPTWTGSENEVNFVTSGSSGHNKLIGITVVYEGEGQSSTPKVNSISIDSTLSINMDNSSTGTINATVDADAGATYSVTWSSSDTTTATVSGNNTSATVTALKAGTVTITARISDAIYSTCTVSITKSEVVPPTPSGEYTLLTDASVLKAGDQIVIANSANGVTATDLGTNTYLGRVTSTFSSDKSTITSLGNGTVEFTLGGSDSAWTLSNGTQYLGATAQGKLAWGSGTTTWSISISDGQATIQNGTSTYGRFLYNTGSPRFTTYTSNVSATMVMPQIYYKSSGGTPDPEKEITSIELECNVTTVIFGEGKGTYEAPAKLKATYNDATSGYITPDSKDYTVNTYELGNHTISATFDGRTYEKTIKVTNVGSVVEQVDFTKTLQTSTSDTSLSANSEKTFNLESTVSGVTTLSVKFTAQTTGTSSTSYTHGMTFKAYDSSGNVVATSEEIRVSSKPGSGKTWEASFIISEPLEVAKVSYTLTTKASGSNIRPRQFDVTVKATDTEFYGKQSNAWADYLVSLTRTSSTCLASDDATKLAGLNEVWSELKTEYEAMVAGSKDSFCSDSENAEILKHYQYIISKFGKSSKYGNDGLEDFVKDSKGNKPVVNSNAGLLSISNKLEPATIVTATVAVAGVVAIGLYFGIKKRKEI